MRIMVAALVQSFVSPKIADEKVSIISTGLPRQFENERIQRFSLDRF